MRMTYECYENKTNEMHWHEHKRPQIHITFTNENFILILQRTLFHSLQMKDILVIPHPMKCSMIFEFYFRKLNYSMFFQSNFHSNSKPT